MKCPVSCSRCGELVELHRAHFVNPQYGLCDDCYEEIDGECFGSCERCGCDIEGQDEYCDQCRWWMEQYDE